MPVFDPVTVIGHFQPIILFLSSTQIFNSTGKTVGFWPLQRRANADRIILVRQTGSSQNVGRNGARGESRTNMRKNPRRILSPQRLPFRHPGAGTTNLTNTPGSCNTLPMVKGAFPLGTTRTTSGSSKNDPPQYSAFPQFAFLPRKPPAAGIAPCSTPAAWRCPFPAQIQIPPASAPVDPTPAPESSHPGSR